MGSADSGLVSVVCLSALLLYNFRVLHAKVDSKMDESACNAQHVAVQKDFQRGEKSFDGLRKDIKELTKAQRESNNLLGRLDERIIQYMQQSGSNPAPTIPAVTLPNPSRRTKN